MRFVYAAGFSNGTVKIGVSADMWNRLRQADIVSRKNGASLTYVMVTPVRDGSAELQTLRNAARETLDQASLSIFMSRDEVTTKELYTQTNTPFIFFEMSSGLFGPVVSENSFSPDLTTQPVKTNADVIKRSDRISVGILRLVDAFGKKLTRSVIKNRLPSYSDADVDREIETLIERGDIVRVSHPASHCGFRYEKPQPTEQPLTY